MSCSDVSMSIYAVYPQLVYNYESKNTDPSVSLSVFAEVTEAGKIQSMTVKNTSSGMIWSVDSVDVVMNESQQKTFAGCPSLRMPGSLDFEDAVYQVIYEDKAGKTKDALFTLKAEEAEVFGKSVVGNQNIQYLVLGIDGKVLYTGPKNDDFTSLEKVRQKYPDALYYREYVLNPELNAIYLMPSVYLNQ
ncbi:MAG: hypothetical protein K5930_04610 [Treponemataceae bacterium]|nr:hypothetical protein [Treponemataceae bacterium]